MHGFWIVLVLLLTVSAPAAGQASPSEPDTARAARELIALDVRLAEATRLKDRAALDSIYHDDFLLVSTRGEIWDKRRNVDFLTSAELTFESMVSEDHSVTVFGETAHMFHGGSARGVRAGQAFSGRGRTFHVFVRSDGRWRLLLTHEGLARDR